MPTNFLHSDGNYVTISPGCMLFTIFLMCLYGNKPLQAIGQSIRHTIWLMKNQILEKIGEKG